MKDSTKKALASLAEAGADYIARQARHYSKMKTLPEEYRDKYAEMSDLFRARKDSIGEYKENIGKGSDVAPEPSAEDEPGNCIAALPDANIPKTYFDDEKSHEQELSATSNDNIGKLSIEDWERQWYTCGKLCDTKLDDIPDNIIGLVRLLYDGEIVYLVRSIELGCGGIRKTVTGLMDISQKKKTLAYRMIKENFDSLALDILPIGGDETAINICRNLERKLIYKYSPLWM